jgi:hypothetical protein
MLKKFANDIGKMLLHMTPQGFAYVNLPAFDLNIHRDTTAHDAVASIGQELSLLLPCNQRNLPVKRQGDLISLLFFNDLESGSKKLKAKRASKSAFRGDSRSFYEMKNA